jgi:glycosyltransferase involved in cell wall biosynthesis
MHQVHSERATPSPVIHSEAAAPAHFSKKPLRVLAYVHLRNIHNSTGAGRVARQVTEHLARQPDTEMRVLADRRDHARVIPLVRAPWDSYNYHFFRQETSRQQAAWFLLDRPAAEDYWHEAQVVYCTAESYVPAKKARLAVTLHDAAFLESDAHKGNIAFRKQRLKWQMLYRKLSRKADLFITVSTFSADRLSHFFPEIRDRLRVVHNAVTPYFFEPLHRAGVNYVASSKVSNRRFILLPGGLHFRKNADLVLDAWPQLQKLFPDLLLAIVNHSSEHYLNRARLLGESVVTLGFVPDCALQALYSSAEAVWFPSRYEGFGLPVIEAMACGAPVVASNASALPEIAGRAAVLVSATNPIEHVEALAFILSDGNARDELRRLGKLRAAAFTWKESARQIKEHLEAIV